MNNHGGTTRASPSRDFLASEAAGGIVLMGVADRGPAKRADLRSGDVVLTVAGAPVLDLAGFYKNLWTLGNAGVEAPLTIQREGRTLDVRVTTADRNRLSNSPRLH